MEFPLSLLPWLCAVLAVLLSALAAVLWQRRKYRQTMGRLMDMLDAAISGTFTEQTYNESLLSAAENKLNGYLSASVVSAQALRVEKEKIKALISDISHQTKTPIANILLYAQLLDEQDLPQESRGCVQSLQTQAEKLNFLIASLVKLSRLETGILSLRPEPNPVQPLLDELEAQFTPKAAELGIRLGFDATDAKAVFDPKWTAEALANLLDNALKYTPAGGVVQVRAVSYELFCRIDVMDTGVGITREEQAKVFSRFYRAPAARLQEGVGIGLYLARQILTEQGGYIKVSSTPGEGSTFSAFLSRRE